MAKRANSPKLSEADVSRQVSDYLEFRGWRRLRNNVGGFARVGPDGEQSWVPFGERGMPDLLFVRYFKIPPGAAMTLWVEMKRPGAKQRCSCVMAVRGKTRRKVCRDCAQSNWRKIERLRGGVVLVIESLDEMVDWYGQNMAWLHSGDAATGQLRLI